MPVDKVKKTVLITEKTQYEIKVEVEACASEDSIRERALEQFLQREDHTEGFIAVLDRDVEIEK